MQASHDAISHPGMIVGSDVLTSDLRSLGSISEVRGRYFLVKRGWWQRNYWLSTDSVRPATAGNRVVLNLDEDHLDDSKMASGPPRG